MKTRIITALVLAAVFFLLVILDIFIINFLVFLFILYFSMSEILKIYSIDNGKNIILISFIMLLILPFSTNSLLDVGKLCIFIVMVLISYLAFIKSNNFKQILPFLYPMIPIFIMFGVYQHLGIWYFVWFVLTVAVCDSGAYFTGKYFGKTHFSKSSPNKTLEGIFGGILTSVIFGVAFAKMVLALDFKTSITVSFMISIFGIFGDLFESYIKRIANIKDSGNLFPGHGGMLDRIDGYMFACIAMFLVFA